MVFIANVRKTKAYAEMKISVESFICSKDKVDFSESILLHHNDRNTSNGRCKFQTKFNAKCF